MSNNYSWLYTIAFCCLYPLVVHAGIVWFKKQYHRIDWDNIRFPWSRND